MRGATRTCALFGSRRRSAIFKEALDLLSRLRGDNRRNFLNWMIFLSLCFDTIRFLFPPCSSCHDSVPFSEVTFALSLPSRSLKKKANLREALLNPFLRNCHPLVLSHKRPFVLKEQCELSNRADPGNMRPGLRKDNHRINKNE